MQGYANWGGLMKELGFLFVTSFSHLLHLCDDAFEARQQFFDERSGKPIFGALQKNQGRTHYVRTSPYLCIQKLEME